jgi:DNA-directed RNA polymerase subunit H (RpoH/RPB5)
MLIIGVKFRFITMSGILFTDPETFLAKSREALQRMLLVVRGWEDGSEEPPTELMDNDDGNILWSVVKNTHTLLLIVKVVHKPLTDALNSYIKLDPPPIKHCIVVYQDKCTPRAGQELRSLPSQGVTMELFSMEELIDDPLESSMSPKSFRLLSSDEVRQLFEAYGALDRFPRILTTYPICRRFNAQPGQVFEIIRHLGIEEVIYRVVEEPKS